MPRSRRAFLTEAALAGAGAWIGVGCGERRSVAAPDLGQHLRPPSGRARVVLVRSATPLAFPPDRARVRRLLEEGVCQLAGVKDARAAIGRWMRTTDTVGLKVNCLAGRMMSTHLELVEELVALLDRAGVRRRQALVFDRSRDDLRRGGYPLRSSGSDYRCLGNDEAGFEPNLTLMPSGASRLSRAATETASVLINVPILKDHGLAGVSGALKNNFGLVHNPNKYHLTGCDPHVAEVNSLPVVRNKQKLIVCDALRVQTDGGPAYRAAAVESFGGLLLGTDPVALDVIAWELLEDLRRKRKLPSLTADKRRPVHILTSARLNLGVGDRAKIDLISVKVS
jgi:uncharacterized protein (DUF362 family)